MTTYDNFYFVKKLSLSVNDNYLSVNDNFYNFFQLLKPYYRKCISILLLFYF